MNHKLTAALALLLFTVCIIHAEHFQVRIGIDDANGYPQPRTGAFTSTAGRELGGSRKLSAGGFSKVQNSDKEAMAAAKFAVTAHDPKLKFNGIEKAEQQIVAGTNYRLTLKVSDDGRERRADAIVWRKLDGQHALTSWTWLDEEPLKQKNL
jgi:Aspartic acid proteinase inhibitor